MSKSIKRPIYREKNHKKKNYWHIMYKKNKNNIYNDELYNDELYDDNNIKDNTFINKRKI